MRKLLASLSFFIAICTPGCADDRVILFRGARVFDGARVLENTDVLVRGSRIENVGRKLAAPEGAEIVNGSGKTLLPGLIDAHTHAYGDALREALMFGVTTELDMFTEPKLAQAWRAEQAAGKAGNRADLFSAGVLVTAPGGHGTEYGFAIPTMTSPENAQQFVDDRIAEGSDWIKLVHDDGASYGIRWPTLDVATMRAVIAAAHKRGKLAVVHPGGASGARAAIDAGADALIHLFVDNAPADDFAATVKKRGAFVIPTMLVLNSISGTAGAAPLTRDPRLEPYLTAPSKASLEQAFPVRPNSPQRKYSVAVETLRKLKAAGVPILAGTDAPNPGTAHGIALHRELELLVEAGLTPPEALAAATSVPARAFRITDRGRIAKGLRADLVLVSGNPTADITATRAIEGVWKGGERADRAAFAKSLADAREAAAKNPAVDVGTGLVSDFDHGSATSSIGLGWMESTDAIAGGKSTGKMEVTAAGTLRISGTISDALPYAWAGAMWSPGAQPMAPANLSQAKELRFRTRGDGGTYRVLVFTASKGMYPQQRTFVAGAEWNEVTFPWTAFGGSNGSDIMAVILCGGPQAGTFAFEVDEVKLGLHR